MPAAGAEQEENDDSPLDSENQQISESSGAEQEEDVDSSYENEVLPLLEVMQKSRFCSPSAEMQCDAAALLEIPFPTVCLSVFSLAQVSALGREEPQLKKDASTQADCRGDRQVTLFEAVADIRK